MIATYLNGLGEAIKSPVLAEFTTPDGQWLVVYDRTQKPTIIKRKVADLTHA